MSTYEEQLAAAGIGGRDEAAIPPVATQLAVQQVPTWKGLFVKAFKTFIQGATAVLLAGTLDLFDASALEAAVTGGFAALISFLNNWASAKES